MSDATLAWEGRPSAGSVPEIREGLAVTGAAGIPGRWGMARGAAPEGLVEDVRHKIYSHKWDDSQSSCHSRGPGYGASLSATPDIKQHRPRSTVQIKNKIAKIALKFT